MKYVFLLLLVVLAGCSTQAQTGEVVTDIAEVSEESCSEPDGVHDCTKGMVNDPYPGACAQYVDENNDGICDKSQ